MHNSTLKRLEKRLDALALDQLREVAARLYVELEEAKRARDYAEESADFWREQVYSLQDQLANESPQTRSLGMTKSGDLLIINEQTH